MQKVYGYIRVSTIRQGTQGVSLQEQKAAIEQYARNNDLQIIEWFEERETAAKSGRPIFSRMMKNLHQKKASGVIIHKIDRSARNLKDWAALGELLDAGVDVRFAHDSMDLHARGGRLSADIQAVIAADYIRNLREETKKGFYGRLKQGIYPLPAPIGYLDQGAGKPKIPEPAKAFMVREIFRLYATGNYSLDQLVSYLECKGYKNNGSGKITRNGLATILHNPFYIGLIRIRRTGETFAGIHEPLISKKTFDTVQDILKGKRKMGPGRHDFLYRRMFICKTCNRSYIGEKQKGLSYYRCHHCKGSCVREEVFKDEVRWTLQPLQLFPEEIEQISLVVDSMKITRKSEAEKKKEEYLLLKEKTKSRLDRLTDAYVDDTIEKDVYLERKESLLNESKKIDEELEAIDSIDDSLGKKITEQLELLKSLYLSYNMGSDDKKRDMVKKISSNCSVFGKNVELELKSPFKELSNYLVNSYGSPYRTTNRSLEQLPDTQTIRKKKLNKREIRRVYKIISTID
ncbi:MAG: recombinase family protein [Desulforudis sp.]|nr:MAG: recombinase family protein [Desulforudis sp.]